MMQVMSGEATPAQIAGIPGRPADEGRDAGGDRRLRPGDARPRDAGDAQPPRPGRHLRHGRRRRGHLQHLHRGRPRRRRRRGDRRQARQPGGVVAVRLGRRAGGAGRADRPRAGGRGRAAIDEVGFGFLFAQAHHPAMRHAGPVRRELGVRTVFNLLGPLTNPAGARRQVIGRLLTAAWWSRSPRCCSKLGRRARAGGARRRRARRADADRRQPGRPRCATAAVTTRRSTRRGSRPAPVPASPDDLRGGRRPGPERGRHPHRVRRRARPAARRRDPERRRRAAGGRHRRRPRGRASTAPSTAIDSGAAAGQARRAGRASPAREAAAA